MKESFPLRSPRRRAAEKRLAICAWIAIFGHSTEAIILSVIGTRSRGVCAQLQRFGLLRPVRVPLASTTKVWTLTPEGVRVAELALGRSVSYAAHPTRLTLSTMTHDLLVQREAVARFPTDLTALRRLRSDRELRHVHSACRPDLLISHVAADGRRIRVCLELEVSSKGHDELATKMRALLHSLDGQTLWLWCITEGETTRRRYADTWAQVVQEHGTGFGLTSTQLLESCCFQLAFGE